MNESKQQKVKVTYTTLSVANEAINVAYEDAVFKLKSSMGKKLVNFVGGTEITAPAASPVYSPVNTDWLVSHYPKQNAHIVDQAVKAANQAFPAWKSVSWQERVSLCRKAAALMEDRLFEIAAVISLEVGKNRLEAIGEVQEVADLVYYACDQMEKNNGYIRDLTNESPKHHNRSVLKPFGVWAVISPFNYPAALTGGPVGAALVCGNTVVIKPASLTPYTAWLTAKCFIDAGFPDGVVNFVTGSGNTVGEALIHHPEVAGCTFTGSSDIGMKLVKTFSSAGRWPRPCVVEMGGKNPTIVTASADLKRAVSGCSRSAFGFGGQKCSAGSRIFVHQSRFDELLSGMIEYTAKLVIGDPTLRSTFSGPVINQEAIERYRHAVQLAKQDGNLVLGGTIMSEGAFAKGYYVAPAIVTGLSPDHALSTEELFLPFVTVYPYQNIDDALRWANSVDNGLTAGAYAGSPEEINHILDHIEAGLVYVNKESGSTTGAWPDYQAFGGWKKSTSTNKGAGHVYYLAAYMREQSQTIID
jgi:1-pyrroline-5-carboxylate dehydrogenase